jgi:stage V sporulation protein SpoVS
MSKSAKKRSPSRSASSASSAKPSRRTAGDTRPENVNSGSKQSRVIAMLQSPAGATIAAVVKVTGWQPHSVRGFLAGVVRKRLKLELGSTKVDGNRVYQITKRDAGKAIAKRQSKRHAA